MAGMGFRRIALAQGLLHSTMGDKPDYFEKATDTVRRDLPRYGMLPPALLESQYTGMNDTVSSRLRGND